MAETNDIVLKNGTVLQLQDGDVIVPLFETDIWIKGNKISVIGKNLEPVPGAEVIDCTNKIVSPGMVDGHNHLWMTQLKARHAEHTLFDYVCSGGLQNYNFTPEDIYWGQLGGCLESIDAGTTTVVDHAHMTNSKEHAEEAIAASVHSGLRSFYCYSPIVRYKEWSPLTPNPDLLPSWLFEHIQELANAQPFGEGRVYLGFGFDMWFLPKEPVIKIWERVKGYGIKLFTTHYCKNRIFGLRSIPELMKDYGLLNSEVIISHATQASAEDGKIIAEAGAYVAAAPESEGQMAMGQPLAFRGDVQITLGADGHFLGPSDIMSQMRMGLQLARHSRNQKILDDDKFPLTNIGDSAQAFNMGTIAGARAVAMEDQIGSIAVGKLADIVIFDALSPTMVCAAQHDPVTAIVRHSTIRDVNTVIVNGIVRKRNGALLPVKLDGQDRISKTVAGVKQVTWDEVATALLATRKIIAEKLSKVDIAGGAEDFKKLAGIDQSNIVP